MEIQSRSLTVPLMLQAVTQAISGGGSFTITVTGGSMVPTLLHQKSQVELVAPGQVTPGQIVLARRENGSLVLHRVIRREDGWLTLNGDAQSWTERVRPEQIVARVSRICRKGRWYAAGTLADRVYFRLWGLTRPLRPGMLKLYHMCKRK